MKLTKRQRIGLNLGSVGVILFVTLACTEVDESGERATTGTCPEGETCSDAAPMGLVFRGQGFFDDETPHLGPVLVGGEFHLGVIPRTETDPMLPDIRIEVDDDGIFTARSIEAQPTWDHGISVSGHAVGRTRLRVLEASTGRLLDRLELQVDEVSDVRIINMSDESREHLVAGQDELIGVRLLIRDGTVETRAIDQKLVFSADTPIQPENLYWDCFSYATPGDRDSVTFSVSTSGRTFRRTFPIEQAATR